MKKDLIELVAPALGGAALAIVIVLLLLAAGRRESRG
jgi:hypothetical protein